MSSSLSRRELVEAVAELLDVAVYLDEPSVEPVACWILDDDEREALLVELAGALGVGHGGAEALERGSLSIDPTKPSRRTLEEAEARIEALEIQSDERLCRIRELETELIKAREDDR